MDMDWRIERGRTAVQAHVETTMNGQETEPFEIQALDAVVDIMHALHVDWDGETPNFDADAFARMCVVHFNQEQDMADEAAEQDA